MSRKPQVQRTRLRQVGPVGRRRATALRQLRPLLGVRAAGRCESPFCRKRRRLDPHHITKRSQGGQETLANIVLLCRACHERVDLPRQNPNYLYIAKTSHNGPFAIFVSNSDVSDPVPLTVPIPSST